MESNALQIVNRYIEDKTKYMKLKELQLKKHCTYGYIANIFVIASMCLFTLYVKNLWSIVAQVICLALPLVCIRKDKSKMIKKSCVYNLTLTDVLGVVLIILISSVFINWEMHFNFGQFLLYFIVNALSACFIGLLALIQYEVDSSKRYDCPVTLYKGIDDLYLYKDYVATEHWCTRSLIYRAVEELEVNKDLSEDKDVCVKIIQLGKVTDDELYAQGMDRGIIEVKISEAVYEQINKNGLTSKRGPEGYTRVLCMSVNEIEQNKVVR